MNKRELQRNVLRGVKLLDEKDPHWFNGKNTPPLIEGMVGHIDLDKLDMQSSLCCVLGQRSRPDDHIDDAEGYRLNGYSSALRKLRISRDDGDENLDVHYGFELPFETHTETRRAGWSYLTGLWTSVIQSRRFPRRKIAKDPFVMRANRTWVRPGVPA